MDQQAAGYAFYYDERTAAKAAAFLRTLESAVDTCLGSTGVRADWMEQDGPALVCGTIKYRRTKHTDTIAVSLQAAGAVSFFV